MTRSRSAAIGLSALEPASDAVLVAPVPVLLRKQVVDILRAAITECRFEPGGRLTERVLCEQLNVSRSTVRESLRQLEAEGLVTIHPHRGPMIPVIDAAEARELYAIRATLDGMASAAAAEYASHASLEELKEAVADIRAVRQDGDFPRVQRALTRFYGTLFDASGNRQLAAMLKHIRARMTLLRSLDGFREARLDENLRGASEILDALARRDPEAARRASVGHIERAAALALAAFDRSTQAPD